MTTTNFLEAKNQKTKKHTIGNYSIISHERYKNDVQKENKSNLNSIYTDCKEGFAWSLSERANEMHRSYSMYDI